MTRLALALPRDLTNVPLFAPGRLHATAIQFVLLVLVLAAALLVPNFASTNNLTAILYAASSVGVAAVGLALVTLSGNLFALSLSATAAFASIIFALLMSQGFLVAALGALAIGAGAGLAQGVAVAIFSTNPIITSIAAASLINGIAILVSHGRTILAGGDIGWLGSGALIPGVPYQALVFLATVALIEFMVERSRTGRELRLSGTNRAAAQLAGLRTSRAVILAYVGAALTAAAAGIMLAAQAGAGNLRVGQDLDFSAIAAVLVGGVSITGGRGRIIDAAVGALFVAVLSNLLLVEGFSYEAQLMVKGLAVIGSVALGAWLNRDRR
jgi:ribose transport system permease protein